MSDLVRRLRQASLPDPHDEREVMCAPLLRDAADALEALSSKLHRCREALDNNLHAKHTNLWVEIREALDND